MDQLLSKAGNQIVTFAIRSGVSVASGYALKTVVKLMERVPEGDKRKIERLRNQLSTRVEILTYAIELIELANARGNSNIESTIKLTRELKYEIDDFEKDIDDILSQDVITEDTVKQCQITIKEILNKIDESIPIINLSMTTSGINLRNGVDTSDISLGRLIQCSNYLIQSNSKKFTSGSPVGPKFDLRLFNIFYNPANHKAGNGESVTWREKFSRSSVWIKRVAPNGAAVRFNYKLCIKENFDDGRYHEAEGDSKETPILMEYSICDIKKIFFGASGKLLKLDDINSPVLILKIVNEENKTEWIALGEKITYDSDEEELEEELEEEEEEQEEEQGNGDSKKLDNIEDESDILPTENSLSSLEYLLRLSLLQVIDQISITEIKDERIKLFLQNQSIGRHSKPEVHEVHEVHHDDKEEVSEVTNVDNDETSNAKKEDVVSAIATKESSNLVDSMGHHLKDLKIDSVYVSYE
ncbi:hypothetical protein B5S33_g2091 [[Candida] boidinii]|nr:hypothetical protein B5S33_g2091 [[Candida] boidinii]